MWLKKYTGTIDSGRDIGYPETKIEMIPNKVALAKSLIDDEKHGRRIVEYYSLEYVKPSDLKEYVDEYLNKKSSTEDFGKIIGLQETANIVDAEIDVERERLRAKGYSEEDINEYLKY